MCASLHSGTRRHPLVATMKANWRRRPLLVVPPFNISMKEGLGHGISFNSYNFFFKMRQLRPLSVFFQFAHQAGIKLGSHKPMPTTWATISNVFLGVQFHFYNNSIHSLISFLTDKPFKRPFCACCACFVSRNTTRNVFLQLTIGRNALP